jgi:hypothetical protein
MSNGDISFTHFGNVGTTRIDLTAIASPSNPDPGNLRIYANSLTGLLGVIDSNGNPASPPAVIGPGTDIDGGTY